jgi:CRP/FNR family transcriptional regulator, dissimilatory nitrate respiration regulator
MKFSTDQVNELRQAYLFAQADDAHLLSLASTMQEMQLAAGDTLFTHGQPAERFFFLRTGQIKLFRISPEGQEKIIEIVHQGQTFAEAVMFMGNQGRYPVNAQAITDCKLFSFEQKAFLRMLSESHDIAFGMLASMSRRLHMLVNQIDSLTLQNATYRLAMYLLEHVPNDAQASPDVQLTTPKGVIASRLAIKPETFSRILAKLKRYGLIDVHGNHIALLNLQGLRDLVYTSEQDEGP